MWLTAPFCEQVNIFARTLGGVFGDKFGQKKGLQGRVQFLVAIIIIEGIVLSCFSQLTYFPVAIGVLVLFSLSVQMAEGATFTVVPFINKKCIGSISGIVGAGGNVGAVLAGFLLKSSVVPATNAAVAKAQAAGLDEAGISAARKLAEASAISSSFLYIGGLVILSGILALTIRFSEATEKEVKAETDSALRDAAGKQAAFSH